MLTLGVDSTLPEITATVATVAGVAIVQRKGNRNRPLYSPCANEDDPSRKLVG